MIYCRHRELHVPAFKGLRSHGDVYSMFIEGQKISGQRTYGREVGRWFSYFSIFITWRQWTPFHFLAVQFTFGWKFKRCKYPYWYWSNSASVQELIWIREVFASNNFTPVAFIGGSKLSHGDQLWLHSTLQNQQWIFHGVSTAIVDNRDKSLPMDTVISALTHRYELSRSSVRINPRLEPWW
jgi:hypothetical protein